MSYANWKLQSVCNRKGTCHTFHVEISLLKFSFCSRHHSLRLPKVCPGMQFIGCPPLFPTPWLPSSLLSCGRRRLIHFPICSERNNFPKHGWHIFFFFTTGSSHFFAKVLAVSLLLFFGLCVTIRAYRCSEVANPSICLTKNNSKMEFSI